MAKSGAERTAIWRAKKKDEKAETRARMVRLFGEKWVNEVEHEKQAKRNAEAWEKWRYADDNWDPAVGVGGDEE